MSKLDDAEGKRESKSERERKQREMAELLFLKL
jgi:hypothetical protein